MVFEAPRGSAPAAEQLARTKPGKDDASGALTPQTSAGEGRGELHAARGGRGHVVGSCRGGAPGVRPRPFVCPLRRSPLPKEGWHRGKREARRWRGEGEAGARGEGRGAGGSTMGAGRGWRGGGPEAEPRGAAGAAPEGKEEKRRKETHPAPNPRVSPVTNRKVLPQEEVIGAVESSRSREPSRERARGLESQCESEPTDRPTDRQRARERGRRGPREEEEPEEGQRGPGPPPPLLSSSAASTLRSPTWGAQRAREAALIPLAVSLCPCSWA